MKGKTKFGATFTVTNIHRLPFALQASPLHRAAVAANKHVRHCEFVLDRIQRAEDEQKGRREAAEQALAEARAAQKEAHEALAKAS